MAATKKNDTIDVPSAFFNSWERGLPDNDHVRFFKSMEWSKTGVGASLENWPVELLCWVQQLLADSRPAIIYWPSYTMLYNEAFIPLAGNAHPTCMGSTFEKTYPEIVHVIVPMFQRAHEARTATDVTDLPLEVMRNGFLEETYFTGNFTPLRYLHGTHAGVYNAVVEVTKQHINDRLRNTLNMIPRSSVPLTTANVWDHMTEVLATNGKDFPMVLLYQLGHEDPMDTNHRLKLKGHIGFSSGLQSAVREAQINDDIGLMALLRQAKNNVFTREIADGELPNVNWAGHGVPSKHISAAPLQNAGILYGYVIVALNPRRPMSDDWHQFVLDLSNQMASTVASTVSTEEAARRERNLQNQVLDSERQIRYMAQHSDISMQQLSLDRKTIWANQHYWNLVGQQDDTSTDNALFEDIFLNESHAKALGTWQQVIQGRKAHTTELELKRIYTNPHGGLMPTTILLSAFPYMVDGVVKSVMACMTEVSRLKWAESIQATLARDANEAKRLQSQFTDAISHEVRNPLSAMLQLAEDILVSAAQWQKQNHAVDNATSRTLDEITNAAKTITVCAKHQKRIVDDVLTLSRMDFNNLTLKPVKIHLKDLVLDSVRILEADALAGNIKITIVEEESVHVIGVDQVICDALRITQVLINLLSNAIKFTKLEDHRNITIRYGTASSNPRATFPSAIRWASGMQEEIASDDVLTGKDWGNGKLLYLTFRVEDTGLGMNEEEMQRVFDRFEQASPQTSIKYGGSGLGLFICRSLCQGQCGGIGMTSRVAKGTTIAFYVGSRLASPEASKTPTIALSVRQKPGSSIISSDVSNLDGVKKSKAIPKVRPPNSSSTNPLYHVLLVEDNIINQQVLSKQLTRAGCVVHVANHGVEALDFLRSTVHWSKSIAGTNRELNNGTAATTPMTSPFPLDVILMDLNMPVMDGLTCTTQIRALEGKGTLTSHLEIIAVTANARSEQAEEAQSVGADAVLRKPFVVSELLDLIEQRLSERMQESRS